MESAYPNPNARARKTGEYRQPAEGATDIYVEVHSRGTRRARGLRRARPTERLALSAVLWVQITRVLPYLAAVSPCDFRRSRLRRARFGQSERDTSPVEMGRSPLPHTPTASASERRARGWALTRWVRHGVRGLGR